MYFYSLKSFWNQKHEISYPWKDQQVKKANFDFYINPVKICDWLKFK